jgi:RNA polymerase sigma-70 factor (ECF subfamily)
MQDDAGLIRATQAGSQEAFHSLVARYHLLVLWTAQALLADSASAEDVAQEAWISAWRALDRFDQSRPFRPWLLRIVTNCCRKQARRAVPQIALDSAHDDQIVEEDLLTHVIRQEEIAALDAVIASLPAIQRQVIELRYRAELDLTEIAMVLDLPLGTVKSRLHRALTAIRQHVARKALATREDAL